jgi:hypothetical protein
MDKENIEAKDKEFRYKLVEMRMNLANRQVLAKLERNKPHPRRYAKVVIPLLMVLVAGGYLLEKTIRSHQPVSASIPNKLQTTQHRYPVPTDQTKPEGISPETESKIGSHSKDNLTAFFKEEESNPEVSDVEFQDEKKKSPSEMQVVKKSEAVNEVQTANQDSNAALSDESTSGSVPELSEGGGIGAPETGDAESVTPAPSSAGSISHHGTRIARNFVCSGVKARTCASRQSVFSLKKNQNPHAWMEVFSDSVPYTLKHVYYHEGRKYVEVPIRIEYRRMRT